MKKVIFAGFGKLGYICLKELIKLNYKIDFVLTHKSEEVESIVRLCKEYNLQFSFSDLRKDRVTFDRIERESAHFLISVNYRYIIPDQILKSTKFPLNLHGSLLPKYRGRTPHVWAIINGENKTGVTCHIMEKTVDTGDIYEQIEIDISPEDTGYTLLQKFEAIYSLCLLNTMHKIDKGISPSEQDHNLATYFGKRIPEMGYIDFNKSVDTVLNFIRAQTAPYPGAYCFLPDGRKMIVYHAEKYQNIDKLKLPLGHISESNNQSYLVKLLDGMLRINKYKIIDQT